MTVLIVISALLSSGVIILFVLLHRANYRVDQSIDINFSLVNTNEELKKLCEESQDNAWKAMRSTKDLANVIFGTNSEYSNIAEYHGLKYWPLNMKGGGSEIILGLKGWDLEKASCQGWVFKTTYEGPAKVFKGLTEHLVMEGMKRIQEDILKRAKKKDEEDKELIESVKFGRKSEKAVIDKLTESASEKSSEWEKEGTPVEGDNEKPPYKSIHIKDLKWQEDSIGSWTKLVGDGRIISIHLSPISKTGENRKWHSLVIADDEQILNKTYANKSLAKRSAITAMNKHLKKLYDTGK